MNIPTIQEIATELNQRARSHPIGALQEIRRHKPGLDLFRINSRLTRDGWACHWGGRTELQFNIGVGWEPGTFRHGVAFSFEASRNYSAAELVTLLAGQVGLFDKFMRLHSADYSDMTLWADKRSQTLYEGDSGPIPEQLKAKDVFVFLGKLQPTLQIDYDLILDDFDRLLPLYRFVTTEGRDAPVNVPLDGCFAFNPGRRFKKRSATVRCNPEKVTVDFRHGQLQEALMARLARKFGTHRVDWEVQGIKGTIIDLVVRRQRGYWFYEIKTAPSPRACIRQALGQLLEYAFWPGAQEAVRLIVVGEPPLDNDAAEYLRLLKKRFALSIGDAAEYLRLLKKRFALSIGYEQVTL